MLEYIVQMNLEIYLEEFNKSYTSIEDYKDINIEDYNF